jgi:hypothetical protein
MTRKKPQHTEESEKPFPKKDFPNSVIFTKASVYQVRNPQDLVKNLENEVIGYRGTLPLLENLNNYMEIPPNKTVEYFNIYQKQFN